MSSTFEESFANKKYVVRWNPVTGRLEAFLYESVIYSAENHNHEAMVGLCEAMVEEVHRLREKRRAGRRKYQESKLQKRLKDAPGDHAALAAASEDALSTMRNKDTEVISEGGWIGNAHPCRLYSRMDADDERCYTCGFAENMHT